MKSVHQLLDEVMRNFHFEFNEVPTEIVLPRPLFERLAYDILPRINFINKLENVSEISLNTSFGQLKIKNAKPEIDPWLKQLKMAPEAKE